MDRYDDSLTSSEQLAIDMQIARDLHEEEVKEARQRALQVSRRRLHRGGGSSSTATETDGFCTGDLNSNRMLYLPCEVEGRLVKMLVDSGASNSAMSAGEMTRLNLQDKLNRRWAGKAVGCGSASILGIVENVLVSIGHAEFRFFFLVLDSEHPLMILGLDQMQRFKCIIDLEDNKLVFGGKGGVEVQFLPPEEREDSITNQDVISQMRRNAECSLM